MGMILRIASSRIVGQGDIVGRSGYFSLNLSANSVMRGRLDARRTLKRLVADLRFIDFQRERREFDKVQLLSFIKRKCSVPEQKNVYNENTVSKDINVFLHSYIEPNDLKQLERYSALLINLGLMREIEKGVYRFQEIDTDSIPDVVILYALCDIKGEDKLLSFDKIQELSLLFCIPIASFLDKVRHIAEVYSDYITYSDNSGIRNIYFKDNIESIHLLDMYYNHEI